MALAAVPPEVPVVAVVETPVGADAGDDRPWVWTDDREAAGEATRYLLRLGHQTVHYVAIPSSTAAQPAHRGLAAALRRRARRCPSRAGRLDPRSGYQAGRVLAADPAVTAVLCGNDDLAARGDPRHARGGPGHPGRASAWSVSTTRRTPSSSARH